MFIDVLPYSDLLRVDDTIWILTGETGNTAYDFRFDQNFPSRRSRQDFEEIRVIGRIGAFPNYAATFESLLHDDFLRLIHSPEEYHRCSQLTGWYPLLQDLTPKSIWFDQAPEPDEVTSQLDWPIFLKGERQTSGHRRYMSIIKGPDEFRAVMTAFQLDPILRWQKIVCREFVPLQTVEDVEGDRLPSSFEFRTFWWKSKLVGFGRYWWQGKPYFPSIEERNQAEHLAGEAARRINAAFLVVDVAQRIDGEWIVIECNDGQESGYAGVSSIGLWQNIITLEKEFFT